MGALEIVYFTLVPLALLVCIIYLVYLISLKLRRSKKTENIQEEEQINQPEIPYDEVKFRQIETYRQKSRDKVFNVFSQSKKPQYRQIVPKETSFQKLQKLGQNQTKSETISKQVNHGSINKLERLTDQRAKIIQKLKKL